MNCFSPSGPTTARRGPALLPAVLAFLVATGNPAAKGDDARRCWEALARAQSSKAAPSVTLTLNLARLADARGRALLREAYLSGEGSVKFYAALGLARLGDDTGAPLLVRTLDSTDRREAALAGAALAHLGKGAGEEWLRLRLLRGRADWAAPVCGSIVDFGLRSSIPQLLGIVKNSAALSAFRQQCLIAIVRFDERRACAFADMLLRETHSPAELIALLGTTRNPRIFPVLDAAFRRWSKKIPQAFLMAFFELGDPRALPLVRSLEYKTDASTLTPAELTLAALGDETALAKCLKLIERGTADPAAMAAQRALARCPEGALPAGLRGAALSKNRKVCTLAVQLLIVRPDEKSGEILRDAVLHQSKELHDLFLQEILKRPNGSAVRLLRYEVERARGGMKTEIAAALLVALQAHETGKRYESADDLF